MHASVLSCQTLTDDQMNLRVRSNNFIPHILCISQSNQNKEKRYIYLNMYTNDIKWKTVKKYFRGRNVVSLGRNQIGVIVFGNETN